MTRTAKTGNSRRRSAAKKRREAVVKPKERSRPHSTTPDHELELYQRIRKIVIAARQTVARGVDLVQVWTNWEIGRHIVQHEQQGVERAAYGQAVLKNLADRLTHEFGRGFSKTNLEYMRRFFLLYHERVPIAQSATGSSGTTKAPTVRNLKTEIAQFGTGQLATSSRKGCPFRLSWTHYVFLMGIESADERSFYEIEATDQGWNLTELRRQFDSSLYERLALSRDKAGIRKLARKGQVVSRVQDILKEPLVLEFLGIGESTRYSESDLESAIISQV